MQDEVKVTQADFEEAASYLSSVAFGCSKAEMLAILLAKYDADVLHPLVYILARHRHQAERETLARMEWRDIESAPRSTHVLIDCPRWGVTEAILGDGGWQGATFNGSLIKCDPVAWMPLPTGLTHRD